MFCYDINGISLRLFNKPITSERLEEVRKNLFTKLNGWRPRTTNRIQLYKASGEIWKYEDSMNQVKDESKRFDEMPKEAIDYVKSLPEFDAAIFEEITGINVNEKSCAGKIVEIDGRKYKLQDV
jgi:hypothetical protein